MILIVEAKREGESVGCFVVAIVRSMVFRLGLLPLETLEVNSLVHLQLKFVIFTKYLFCYVMKLLTFCLFASS